MNGYNHITILGHLGKSPEVRDVSGTPVANFPVATARRWVDKQGQKQERTDWHRVTVWGKQAELCGQYLGKGSKALIDGRLESRNYVDKDGVSRTICEIKAQQVVFLDSKGERPASDDGYGLPDTGASKPSYEVIDDSQVPF